MSSNRLIDLLRKQFIDPTVAKKCRESSKNKIVNKDCSRVFDDFPTLLDLKDPRVEKLTRKLNFILAQIHNHFHYKESFRPAEDNLNHWLTQITIMGKNELLDSDGYIKTELLDLLEWNKLCLQIDVQQLLRAYLSMVLPQLVEISLNSYKGCPPEYTAVVLSHASNHSSDCIARALTANNTVDLTSFLIPAGIVTLGIIGGILTWSFSSNSPKEDKKEPERKAGNF